MCTVLMVLEVILVFLGVVLMGPGGDSGGLEGLMRSALGALGAPYEVWFSRKVCKAVPSELRLGVCITKHCSGAHHQTSQANIEHIIQHHCTFTLTTCSRHQTLGNTNEVFF